MRRKFRNIKRKQDRNVEGYQNYESIECGVIRRYQGGKILFDPNIMELQSPGGEVYEMGNFSFI